MLYNTNLVEFPQYDYWTNPPVTVEDEEPESLDIIVRDRETERAKKRSSLKHCIVLSNIFAADNESQKSILERARREWKLNRRMIQRGLVQYSDICGNPAAAALAMTNYRIASARAPKPHTSALSASRHREEDDSGGDEEPPLIIRLLGCIRNIILSLGGCI